MLATIPKRESQPNDGPVSAETIVDVLRQRAELTPSKRVFLFLDRGEREGASYTFAQLDRKARAIGGRLAALRVRGKQVLLPNPPGLEFVANFFGCLYAGAVAVPACSSLLSTRKRDRLRSIVEDADVEFILAASTDSLTSFRNSVDSDDWIARLTLLATDEVAETEAAEWSPTNCRADDVAYIQYSSGSTSAPKGIVISHGNVMCNQEMLQQSFGTSEDSVVVSWLPHFHDMGLVGVLQRAIYVGMSAVLLAPIEFIRRPVQWLRAISRYQAAISIAPNFAYDLCVERVKEEAIGELDLSCWQVAFNGSEPVKVETMKRFAEKFSETGFRRESFYPCYGLAEATVFVTSRLPSEPVESRREVVSCGPACTSERVLIVDPQTQRRCSEGNEGEIWIAGPHVAQGYWKRDAETRETFKARLSDNRDGPFLRTGDLGFLLDGELHVTGRLKELIILHGKNHYPQDIEATVATSHPLLRRDGGAAFSVDITGSEALVVLQEVKRQTPPEKSFEIKSAIRQALAEDRAIKPYSIVLLKPNTIPKTSSGKIMRSTCRANFLRNSLTENIFA
jgi:acyl-CoA synthetase (AMP-forming)/AMP-acid ligase II